MTAASEWRRVPMPERIAALPLDPRGFPVPYIVLRDEHGAPHLGANDLLLVDQVIRERRCHVCGEPLEARVWFVGGPASALLNGAHSVYADGPLHHECLRYSMQVCPYLAHRTVRPMGDASRARLAGKVTIVESDLPGAIGGMPPLFVAVQTERFKVTGRGADTVWVVPRPWRRAEYWQHGALLELDAGRKLAARHARELTPPR